MRPKIHKVIFFILFGNIWLVLLIGTVFFNKKNIIVSKNRHGLENSFPPKRLKPGILNIVKILSVPVPVLTLQSQSDMDLAENIKITNTWEH